MSAFDRPIPPDVPDEAAAVSARKVPERSDIWPNVDDASDEDLVAFLGLDRADRVRSERADRPYEVRPVQADADYYPNVPRTVPERLVSVPVFDGPPRREQVSQGVVGDCGVLSALGAVAGHRPDTIKNLIQPVGDGTFEVRLHEVTPATRTDPVARPTGDTRTYRVNDEIPVGTGDRKPVGANADRCGWPALLEKVIAAEDQTWDTKQKADWDVTWQTRHKFSVDSQRAAAGLPPSPPDAPTGYNRIDLDSTAYQRANLLAQLTGQEAEVREIPGSQQGDQALLNAFRDQLDAGKPILVGTRKERFAGELFPSNVDSGHAYEVTKIEGDRIHLHNPWGTQYNPAPLDATTFGEYFRRYNYDGTRNGLYTTLI